MEHGQGGHSLLAPHRNLMTRSCYFPATRVMCGIGGDIHLEGGRGEDDSSTLMAQLCGSSVWEKHQDENKRHLKAPKGRSSGM